MTDNWTEVRREVIAQPVSIELTRGQKGGHGWTIKVYSDTGSHALELVEGIDKQLRRDYVDEEYGGDNVETKA